MCNLASIRRHRQDIYTHDAAYSVGYTLLLLEEYSSQESGPIFLCYVSVAAAAAISINIHITVPFEFADC